MLCRVRGGGSVAAVLLEGIHLYPSITFLISPFTPLPCFRKQISAVDPTFYAERFVRFITEHTDSLHFGSRDVAAEEFRLGDST